MSVNKSRDAFGHKSGRIPFAIAGLLLTLFAANMAARIAQVQFAATVWSVGDVGEFLLVLLCMVFFVAGLLTLEAQWGTLGAARLPSEGEQ